MSFAFTIIHEIAQRNRLQLLHVPLLLLGPVIERGQHSLRQVLGLLRGQLPVIDFLEVDLMPVSQDFNGSNQIVLILVVAPDVLRVADPPLHSDAFPPAFVLVLDILVQLLVQVNEVAL